MKLCIRIRPSSWSDQPNNDIVTNPSEGPLCLSSEGGSLCEDSLLVSWAVQMLSHIRGRMQSQGTGLAHVLPVAHTSDAVIAYTAGRVT